MQLTYLAHASLLVEEDGVRLVTDPWLDGPTYLGAWWHFPAPAARGADLAGVDWVYLTHEHVDHFHEPTLACLPRSTPILIGRFMTSRFRDRLRALGFADVRELPHGEEVALSPSLHVTSYQYRADDTALVVRGRDGTVLDLNDSLTRDRSLAQILDRHPRIDLLAASFANAEAYPIVYDFDDPAERVDWDDASRFDGFLEKVRQIAPAAFAPFASMFCFLDEELFALNDRIVTPAPLVARARAGEVRAAPLPLDPGDRWSPARGHEVERPVDWARKDALLVEYAARAAPELARRRAAARVPGGRAALADAFAARFRGFLHRVPWPVRRALDVSIRFDVTGEAAQLLWLRFGGGRLELAAPARDDAWDVKITVPGWALHRVLAGRDTWQTLGISCRFRVALRPHVRERELLFWTLLYLDDLGYLTLGPLLSPRALGVVARRHREVREYARGLLGGRFVQQSLRDKFAVK